MTCRACKHPTHKPKHCNEAVEKVWRDGSWWDVVCNCVPWIWKPEELKEEEAEE